MLPDVWRIAKANRAEDLSGSGAAILGGRWNHIDIPALYFGLTPAICALETFVHANTLPDYPLKIIHVQLPQSPELYHHPNPINLPDGWDSKPVDRISMNYGSAWLNAGEQLGMILPSAILPLENNILINPLHPAAGQIQILEVLDFSYDPRMFLSALQR